MPSRQAGRIIIRHCDADFSLISTIRSFSPASVSSPSHWNGRKNFPREQNRETIDGRPNQTRVCWRLSSDDGTLALSTRRGWGLKKNWEKIKGPFPNDEKGRTLRTNVEIESDLQKLAPKRTHANLRSESLTKKCSNLFFSNVCNFIWPEVVKVLVSRRL